MIKSVTLVTLHKSSGFQIKICDHYQPYRFVWTKPLLTPPKLQMASGHTQAGFFICNAKVTRQAGKVFAMDNSTIVEIIPNL
jgi:hypothetical protein